MFEKIENQFHGIQSLNRQNYSAWKFRIKFLFKREDIYSIVINVPPLKKKQCHLLEHMINFWK